MNVGRGLFVHVGLFVLASVSAVAVWTRDEQPKALVQTEATVWPGRPADVAKVVFEGKNRKVSLESKSDKLGAYYLGTLEREATPPPATPDAGAPPPAPGGSTKTEFVGVGVAQKLVESLAPLKALRALGRIPEDRAAEFGLAEPEGTLTVTIGGAERKLVLGGTTPGGGDRYVREPQTGETYVIDGGAMRDLDTAESRLVERELHGWKEAEVSTAELSAGGKKRQIVRGGPEGKRFWADPGAADQKDETAANFMAKLDRLRPTDYVTSEPAGKNEVLRVEYAAGSPIGFLELVRVPATDPLSTVEYFVRTERTRLYAKVPRQTAEQVEQDLGSILK
ncbi:DUF4340 domain-containing protein [Polyangium sp. y55x31]|uniref:DUF4340 domain-containing protein n=1 Tax=Polyangium sp. y55x31 TaxID=3042688 RepID=UPI0024830EDB|nr:DUF4340 domain-containing protein [Polyangium sp. y55x31]MDI1474956.1 DUF4340 domain-containing protein [Polyangium sp. y55x31]